MAKEVVNIDIQIESKSVGELEEELSQINEELKQVKIGSQAFKDLSADSQKLTADLEKVNKEIEGFTLDKKIETSQAAVLGLAGGLEATVGTLGLLGVESEVFGKFEEKAISALTAARGFIDLSEGFGKLAKNISFATIKSKIFGITTKQALIATGIGIFAVALGSIIAYWDDIIKGVNKAAEKFPLLGIVLTKIENSFNTLIESMRPVLEFFGILPDAAERANNAMIEGNEQLIESNNKAIDVLKARGATQEEIYKKQEELLMAELDNLRRTDAEAEDIESKAHELTLLRISEETRKRKDAFDERIRQIQLSEALEKERKEIEEEWFANFGDEAAMSFTEAFNKTVDENLMTDPEFIDEDFEDVFDGLLGEDGVVTKFRQGLDDAIKDTLANRENWNEFFSLASQAFGNIEMLSQQKYDRTLLNLQRERDEILNNSSLTEEERAQALARIEKKEKDAEIRRIKAERDQFTLKQTLAGLEAVFKAKMFALEMVQIAKKQVANATATAQEIALAGVAATGKASMSIGAFIAALGPFGVAAFALTIGGVIASIVSARKNAKSQIAAISGGAAGGSSSGPELGSTPSQGLANIEDTSAPQFSGAQPAIRTYVLSGDVTKAQEADNKINKRRKVG
jgi:hypothetical protein